jgi:hypothetical protein
MKKLYCCEASRGMYEDYYINQSGSGLPVYHGSSGQRGHGLGSMLSGLFRSAMPMIKRGLAFFGRQALKTGLEVANDVADGQSFEESARSRIPTGIKRFVETANFSTQSGSGRYGRKRKRNKLLKKKKKSRHNDIFT